MLKEIYAYILLGLSVAICLLLGKVLSGMAPLLPASLWGMLCFAIGLTLMDLMGYSLKGLFQQPVNRIVKYLSFVFVPVCVGITQYGELIAQSGGKILLVGVSSTLVTLSVVAWLSKKCLNSSNND